MTEQERILELTKRYFSVDHTKDTVDKAFGVNWDKLMSLFNANLEIANRPTDSLQWVWQQEPSLTLMERIALTVCIGTLLDMEVEP